MCMDNFADERDQKQLEQDRYTFFVLRRILGGNCKLLLTDHARLILGNMAAINLVFTRPEFRRKHYAQNLVYQVTKLARDAGYIPMLYTDADYAASNACYEKIGYVLRGRLCTIGEAEQ